MDFHDFYAGQDDNERRLDRVIRRFLTDTPLSEIYKLIRKGLIKVNDKKTKADCRVNAGDKISIAGFFIGNSESSLAIKDGQDFNPDFTIEEITVFQNEHILILDKPYDVKVHGDEKSLDVAVKKYYEKISDSDSLSFTPGPLHRLDRKTTGLIAFSMSLKGAKWFSENIKNHSIQKIYMGIVEGDLLKTERWEDFISKQNDTESRKKKFHTVTVLKSGQSKKNAITTVTPLHHALYKSKKITLCEFDIETGKTHQIRSQASSHGFPLLGDTAYSGTKISHDESNREFFLHATKLIFPENDLGLPKEITSLPDDFLL